MLKNVNMCTNLVHYYYLCKKFKDYESSISKRIPR